MKFIRIITAMTIFLISLSCGSNDGAKQSPNTETKQEKKTDAMQKIANRIEVYEFHSTHRCVTCNAIEANTKFTLKTYFADEMEAGKITYHLVNVDEEKNYPIAEKFAASGTSLFLDIIIDGHETQLDLTEFAFMSGTDKDEFSNELKIKIEKQLKNL